MRAEKKESLNRKQIAFDLNQAALKLYYPKPKFSLNKQFYKKAYKDIAKFMCRNGFERQQYSVYVSKDELTQFAIHDVMEELVANLPWLWKVITDITVTNVGEVYNLTGLVVDLGQGSKRPAILQNNDGNSKPFAVLQDSVDIAEAQRQNTVEQTLERREISRGK